MQKQRLFSILTLMFKTLLALGLFWFVYRLNPLKQCRQNSRLATIVRPYQHIRIFCMILTHGYRHEALGVHVKRTWARYCDYTLFVSDEEHGELEPVVFNKYERWGMVKLALSYAYHYHLDDGDWFLKVHDNNFIVVENLRYLLSSYTTDMPIYFGAKLKDERNQSYMYAHAGVALSKETLKRFVTEALPNVTICRQENDGDEAFELANCLRNVGVIAGDSRDEQGRHTFIPFLPQGQFRGLENERAKEWFEKSYYNIENNTNYISPHSISFEDVHPVLMYDIDYFIHRLRLFGVRRKPLTLPKLKNFTEILNEILQQDELR